MTNPLEPNPAHTPGQPSEKPAVESPSPDVEHPWLRAMFAYYDRHGLPVGTLPLRALIG